MGDEKGSIPGIHHITAITGDARENINFYTDALGLRLVKLTVNFDDPSAYHLYFGDKLGRPGTALTFFAWPGARPGRRGTHQATSLSFSVPDGALGFWSHRLGSLGVDFDIRHRFDEEFIAFRDPDGLGLELVAHAGAKERPGWDGGPIPIEQAIRGFYHVTLTARNHEPTARFLVDTMGFKSAKEDGDLHRFATGPGGAGASLDIRREPDAPSGLVALGAIHHVAWRTPGDREQAAWHQYLAQRGVNVTQIIDRYYFHSIYFREPGGVLFEIATDPPGFAIDEPPERLGSGLRLPPWLENRRALIERSLPPIELRKVQRK